MNRSQTRDNVSLNRNRGWIQDNVPLNRSRSNSPYAHQDNVSLNRNRSNSPYTHQDNVSLNRSKSNSPYAHQDNISLNRNRSNSPYTYQDNVSLNRNRGQTRDNVPLNRSRSNNAHQDNVSLNRNMSNSPYTHQDNDNVSLNESRSRSPYSHQQVISNRKRTPHSSHRENYLLNVRDIERERRESNVSEENHGRNKSRERNRKEISELCTAISNLGREDEVVQILKGLDDFLTIDHKNRWTDIERHVTQDTIPAIKRVLGNKFQYTDIELKKKKERQQRGFCHMLNRRDQKLTDLQPSIPWDDWIEGLEAIINDSSYHSNEISESDKEKVQEEKNRNIRPSRNENSNHIQNFLRHADLTGESIQNIKVGRKRWYNDQLYIENNSKPPRNALAWAISSSYRSE
ncbi:unnamed protein product [Rhizophagus irregularis]|nr:unnamed protein product [Rhizophagus irregularis]